jgi:hypothetical protein
MLHLCLDQTYGRDNAGRPRAQPVQTWFGCPNASMALLTNLSSLGARAAWERLRVTERGVHRAVPRQLRETEVVLIRCHVFSLNLRHVELSAKMALSSTSSFRPAKMPTPSASSPVQTVLTRRVMREAVRQVRETDATEPQCDANRNEVVRCFRQACRSVCADGLLQDENAGSRRLKNICKSCLRNERRGFGRREPARFPLRLFRPFAALPLNCEQKDRDFMNSRLARVTAFLVAIETDRFFADDCSEQSCFLVCFLGCSSAGRQIPNWPPFGNDPVPSSAGRDKQDLDLTVFRDPEWEGAALVSNCFVRSGHLMSWASSLFGRVREL